MGTKSKGLNGRGHYGWILRETFKTQDRIKWLEGRKEKEKDQVNFDLGKITKAFYVINIFDIISFGWILVSDWKTAGPNRKTSQRKVSTTMKN